MAYFSFCGLSKKDRVQRVRQQARESSAQTIPVFEVPPGWSVTQPFYLLSELSAGFSDEAQLKDALPAERH
jgi:hypothetical protein